MGGPQLQSLWSVLCPLLPLVIPGALDGPEGGGLSWVLQPSSEKHDVENRPLGSTLLCPCMATAL